MSRASIQPVAIKSRLRDEIASGRYCNFPRVSAIGSLGRCLNRALTPNGPPALADSVGYRSGELSGNRLHGLVVCRACSAAWGASPLSNLMAVKEEGKRKGVIGR